MGRFLIMTGEGKGKSTAAFGLCLRAYGRGIAPIVLQFIKRADANYGEHRALSALGIPVMALGDGFTWRSKDLEATKRLAQAGWARASEVIRSGRYGLVVLDGLTYVLNFGWLDRAEVVSVFTQRPEDQHLVVTGRDAPAWLVAMADTVTEMRKVKHAYDQGIPATKGIEL